MSGAAREPAVLPPSSAIPAPLLVWCAARQLNRRGGRRGALRRGGRLAVGRARQATCSGLGAAGSWQRAAAGGRWLLSHRGRLVCRSRRPPRRDGDIRDRNDVLFFLFFACSASACAVGHDVLFNCLVGAEDVRLFAARRLRPIGGAQVRARRVIVAHHRRGGRRRRRRRRPVPQAPALSAAVSLAPPMEHASPPFFLFLRGVICPGRLLVETDGVFFSREHSYRRSDRRPVATIDDRRGGSVAWQIGLRRAAPHSSAPSARTGTLPVILPSRSACRRSPAVHTAMAAARRP